jgi:hypothetical protein
MSKAFICAHAERLYVSWRGLIDLLDMDNIQCRKDNQLTLIPIEHCEYCQEVVWEDTGVNSQDWEYYMNKETLINGEIGTEYEYYDSGE